MNEGYNKYNEEVVFLVVTITPLDTYEKIHGLYLKNSGVEPAFPIVTFQGGGRDFASMLGPVGGGQLHIIHPNYTFNKGKGSYPYKQPNLNESIQEALDDDCDDGDEELLFTLTVDNGNGDGEHKEGARIAITADDAPSGKRFDKWTGDTEYVDDVLNNSTTLTMPAKAITVRATYKDKDVDPIVKKDNYMVYASWEAGIDEEGSTVAIDSSKKADTVLTASFDLKKSNSDQKIWTWSKISGYADGKFDDVTSVELAYAASQDVNLILDQKGLSEKGESYRYTLPAAELGKVKVAIKDFKQPSWIKSDDATNLDLTQVISLSFAATKEEVKTDLELQGIYLEGYIKTPILTFKKEHKNKVIGIQTTVNKGISFTTIPSGNYSVSLYSLDGRKLLTQKSWLQNASIISLANRDLTAGVYVLTVHGTAASITLKITLK